MDNLTSYDRFNLLMKVPKINLKYTLNKIGIEFRKEEPKHVIVMKIVNHQEHSSLLKRANLYFDN